MYIKLTTLTGNVFDILIVHYVLSSCLLDNQRMFDKVPKILAGKVTERVYYML